MKKKTIGCLVGRPGAGKGYICKSIKIPVLSMSEILNRSRAQKASSDDTVGSIMDRGEIVPTRIVISLLEKEIEILNADMLIIDGFPRTIEQARFLETQNEFKAVAFYVKAKRKLCVDRIKNADNRGARKDDELEKIISRQDIFESETLPAIKYLEGGGIVPVPVLDGKKPREINAELIMKNLQAVSKGCMSC